MRPETREIVAEVERKGRYPLHVVPVRGLGVVATASLSPKLTDSYVIRYRPGISFVDFAVAMQCMQILRVLDLPEVERMQFAPAQEGLRWGLGLVRSQRTGGKGGVALPEDALEAWSARLVGSLLTQLRSIPVAMRIHESLATRFPSLTGQQAEAIAVEQQEALGSLNPAIRQTVPEEVVAGSVILNTVYAQLSDRLLGTTAYRVPYEAAGFAELGAALLEIYDDVPADPASDRVLVDRWAEEIGLSGKYEWVPIDAPTSPAS